MTFRLPRSRAAARAAGIPTYRSSRRCAAGHRPVRYAANGMCVACHSVRRNAPPQARLRRLLRDRVERAVRRGRFSPAVEALVGVAFGTFRAHLVALLPAPWTWADRGVLWHVDHVRPLASFDLADPAERAAAFALRNLAPLAVADNLRKGARPMPPTPPLPLAIVSVSGGKDSTATALLALDALARGELSDVRFVHADVGSHEHELTRDYVRTALPAALGRPVEVVRADFAADIARKRTIVETSWVPYLVAGVPLGPDDDPELDADDPAFPAYRYPPLSLAEAEAVRDRALAVLRPTGDPFLDLCLWKGRFPSRKAQFCTEQLKRFPLDRYLLDLRAADPSRPVESWQGVRRDESSWRASAAEYEPVAEGWAIRRPIVNWDARRVVDFVRSRGVPLNPLYSLGCDRVGCMVCVNAGKEEIANMAARWPEHVARIREWESLVGRASRSAATVAALLHARSPRRSARAVAEASRIDSAVEWAKTRRGGTQYDLFRLAPPPSCSSSYGLCE